jgi:glutathione S-transferase
LQLIGQYDSPFVRRVGIALTLYELPFEHLPWAGFGDVDRIARVNPLRRVPTLVMDDGQVLVDSAAILDCLDDIVGPGRALIAATGPDRREALRVCALAAGVADKAVSLVYEGAFRDAPAEIWVSRCRAQVLETLALLDRQRAERPEEGWFGPGLTHADVMLATMLRFVSEALPAAVTFVDYPALAAHSAHCEALPVFKTVSQPFSLTPPKP